MLQVILTGLPDGVIIGLVAMAYSVVFYVVKVINFAQGQLIMVSTMITGELALSGCPVWIALVAGVLASIVASVLTYFVAVRTLLAFNRFAFAWFVTTLGVAIILENGAAMIWGTSSVPFPLELLGHSVHIGNSAITWQGILIVVVGVVAVIGFEQLRRRTIFGKLGMAVAEDPEMASAFGANPTTMAVGAFVIGGLLSGVAGILVGPQTFANPYLGDTYGIEGFAAIMMAGTRRPVAAMYGGVLLGVLSEAATTWIDTQASSWFPLVAVMVVLIISPEGLFRGTVDFRALLRLTKSDSDSAAVESRG